MCRLFKFLRVMRIIEKLPRFGAKGTNTHTYTIHLAKLFPHKNPIKMLIFALSLSLVARRDRMFVWMRTCVCIYRVCKVAENHIAYQKAMLLAHGFSAYLLPLSAPWPKFAGRRRGAHPARSPSWVVFMNTK